MIILQNSPAIQALQDAGVADVELNEILLKEEEPVSYSATHCNSLSLSQQVKQPQRRDDMKAEYAVICVRHIIQSELLTEDDLLLVSSLCDHYMEEQNIRCSQSSSPLASNSWLFIAGLVIVIIAVLSTPLIICVSIVVLVVVVMVHKIKYYYKSSLVRKGESCLQDYLKQFDSLLVLFTKCLRLIQETEVISRGYTRLTAWMPVSRIERQGTAGYQCVVLRRCIVKVCECLLSGIQPASTKLRSTFPLKLELADYQQLPPLEDLTQEDDILAMNSLKFQIRMVAVHNSAMLRVIALCLDGGFPLSHLLSILPTDIVCDAYLSLKQSFEFHRNRVFDKPSSAVHKSSTKQQASHDTLLVEELTSMDIRTQMIIKRLRELISKLSEAVPDVETIKSSLMELEGDYKVIQEQCGLAVRMMSKQEHHSPSSSVSSSVIDNDAAITGGSESESCEDQSSTDSSEVFEGLASGSENGGDDNNWQDETKEEKEASIAMMKELRNVLTVRTANKTSLKVKRPKRTKSKHLMKKKGKVPSQDNRTIDQLNKDMQHTLDGRGISEGCSTTLPSKIQSETVDHVKDDTPLIVAPSEVEAISYDDNKDNTTQDSTQNMQRVPPVPEEPAEESHQNVSMDDANPIMMRHIAAMAAKIALKQSAGQEEVFGSEQ